MAKQDPNQEPHPPLYTRTEGARILVNDVVHTVTGGRRPLVGDHSLIECKPDKGDPIWIESHTRCEGAPAVEEKPAEEKSSDTGGSRGSSGARRLLGDDDKKK